MRVNTHFACVPPVFLACCAGPGREPFRALMPPPPKGLDFKYGKKAAPEVRRPPLMPSCPHALATPILHKTRHGRLVRARRDGWLNPSRPLGGHGHGAVC